MSQNRMNQCGAEEPVLDRLLVEQAEEALDADHVLGVVEGLGDVVLAGAVFRITL